MKTPSVLGLIIFFMGLSACPNSAQADTKTILALGDSITAGAPAFRSPAEIPPKGRGNPQSQYAYWLHEEYPAWTINNRGVSGQTTGDILLRLDHELGQPQPQIVILMAGVNDIFRGYSQTILRANLQRLYEEIQERGIPLMVLTILPYRGLTPQKAEVLEEVNRWIQSYAAQQQLGFCDTFKAMRSEAAPLNLSKTSDGLHPDPEGYRILGETIAASLAEWEPFKRISEL